MSWKLDKDRPICLQIVEQLCVRIAAGECAPGERLMSVRDVALDAGINPNTVQKAFEQLECRKLIYSVRGSGWYVGENTDIARQIVAELTRSKTETYFGDMAMLGMDETATRQYVEQWRSETTPTASEEREDIQHE